MWYLFIKTSFRTPQSDFSMIHIISFVFWPWQGPTGIREPSLHRSGRSWRRMLWISEADWTWGTKGNSQTQVLQGRSLCLEFDLLLFFCGTKGPQEMSMKAGLWLLGRGIVCFLMDEIRDDWFFLTFGREKIVVLVLEIISKLCN